MKDSPPKAYIVYIILAVIILAVGIVALYSYRQLRTEGMKSCVWSLEAPVRISFENGDLGVNIQPGVVWERLHSEQMRLLVSDLVKSRKTDCGTFDSMLEGNDYWGNPIKIYLMRVAPSGKARVKISSDGADGKESTEDDITVESSK
jgi:hypothetical protein